MRNNDVAHICALWNEYAASANDRDLERWMSLWIDESIQMPADTPRRVGKELIRMEMQPCSISLPPATGLSKLRRCRSWAIEHILTVLLNSK
jgi:hypothetical protein